MPMPNRILIVEDEKVLAENFKTYLDRYFPNVRIAADGKCAMEMVGAFEPDVVVLDYGLPGKNGLQILSDMQRESRRPMGCVMVTGYPLEKIAGPANELGVNYMLCKPFCLSELKLLVERSAEQLTHPQH